MRDSVNALTGNLAAGYISVFLLEALALLVSLLLLKRISVARFREGDLPPVIELAGYVDT